MGIRQSVDITIPQTDHVGKAIQNGAVNGHAISDLDLPDAASSKVSVPQNSASTVHAMTQANNAKPALEPVPANAKEASAAVVPVEGPPEQAIPVKTSIPTNEEAPTPVQTGGFFKMFKKKNESLASEPVTPEPASSEVSVQQNSEPPAVTQASNSKPEIESVPANAMEASAAVLSVEAILEKAIPAETNIPVNEEAPKPAQTSSFFKMFKKKNEPVAPESVVPEPVAPEPVSVQQNSEPPAMTDATDAKPTPESVQTDAAVVPSEASSEQASLAETDAPANKEARKSGQKSSFFKKFKKKKETAAPEPPNTSEPVQQNSDPPALTQANDTKPEVESVPANAMETSAAVLSVEALLEQVIPAEANIPVNEEAPKPAQTSSFFRMFKKKNEPVAPESVVPESVAPEPESVQQNSEPPAVTQVSNAEPESVPANAMESSATDEPGDVPSEQAIPAETTTNEEAPKPAQTASFFKLFKKKNEPVAPELEEKKLLNDKKDSASSVEQIIPEVQTDGQKSEPPDIKGSTEAEKVPQGELLSHSAAQVAEASTQLEETVPEENPVMNFFKTLVSPTKVTKDVAAVPDVSKDQSQKETLSAPTANVQEALKVPPPPPPAPPKMESKPEPAIKKEEAPPAEAAAAAKETPSKAKAKDSPFGKLFRPKSVAKKEAQPVVVQVDPSKTSTLEAAAKPEPPPAPKPEEKKSEKKSSPFANLLKPKVLLGQVSSKIQAAASSAAASVSLGTGRPATESKKEAPAATPAVAEASASTKAKEEPKAIIAAAAAASPDNKSVGSADNPSPSTPRKLEKRNSIQLFFKNLGQKRHSDAGVQTEAIPTEKAK